MTHKLLISNICAHDYSEKFMSCLSKSRRASLTILCGRAYFYERSVKDRF